MKTDDIIKYEEEMWRAVLHHDKQAFRKLVCDDAVMICGGGRCTGAQYAELIGDFGITGYEINEFEIITETDNSVQVHYIVRTIADSAENADLAGIFHVTSTWERHNGVMRLIFNMDQRVFL